MALHRTVYKYPLLAHPLTYFLLTVAVMAFDFWTVFNKMSVLTMMRQTTSMLMGMTVALVLVVDGLPMLIAQKATMTERSARRIIFASMAATIAMVLIAFMTMTVFLPDAAAQSSGMDFMGIAAANSASAAGQSGNAAIAVGLAKFIYTILPIATSVFLFGLSVIHKEAKAKKDIDKLSVLIEKIESRITELTNYIRTEDSHGFIRNVCGAIYKKILARSHDMKASLLTQFTERLQSMSAEELGDNISSNASLLRRHVTGDPEFVVFDILPRIENLDPMPASQETANSAAIGHDPNRAPVAESAFRPEEAVPAEMPQAAEPQQDTGAVMHPDDDMMIDEEDA